MQKSVRSDLFRLVFSSVSALTLMGAGLAFLFLNSIGQGMEQERRDFAAQSIAVISSALETPLTALRTLSLPPFESQLIIHDPRIERRLQALLTTFPFFIHILVTDPSGRIILSVPDQVFLTDVSLSTTPWFLEAKKQKKPQFSKTAQNYLTGQAEFTLVYPMEEGGFIFTALDVKELLGSRTEWQEEGTKQIIILEEGGTFVYHPDQSLVSQQQVDPVFLKERRDRSAENFEYSQKTGGRTWWVSARPLEGTGWYVLVRQDQETYWTTFSLTAMALLFGLVLLLGLELLFVLGLSRNIWTGIEDVAAFAAAVGNGTAPPESGQARYPEYKQLMVHLEDMAEKIQEREVFLRSLVENLPFNFWTISGEGIVLWSNERAARSGGVHPGSHLKSSDLAENEINFFLEALEQSFKGNLSQMEVRRKGEEEVYLILHAVPVLRGGKFRGQLCFEQDVTPIRKAEQTIRRQVKELEQFTYAASHDLKSPLITIQGFLGGMKGDLKTGRTDRIVPDLERVIKAVDRMGSLVTDLLELSRVGRIPGILPPCSLGQLFDEAVEMLAGIFSQTDHRIIRDTPFPTLPGDRSRLREVWQNLLENAVKYRNPQRPLELHCGCSLKGSSYEFYLRDNGQGVEEPYREKVFGLFEQLDKSADGTGIGLALVRKIIENNGGKVWMESEGKDLGVTVFFTLPNNTD